MKIRGQNKFQKKSPNLGENSPQKSPILGEIGPLKHIFEHGLQPKDSEGKLEKVNCSLISTPTDQSQIRKLQRDVLDVGFGLVNQIPSRIDQGLNRKVCLEVGTTPGKRKIENVIGTKQGSGSRTKKRVFGTRNFGTS